MGLTYKALKYRDIKMNMTKAKTDDSVSDIVGDAQNEISVQQTSHIANDTCSMLIDDDEATTTKTANSQQQFTAEHIMQLCLFLAEKSRAKQQLQHNQEMNARRYYENFLKEAAADCVEDEAEPRENDVNIPQIQTHTVSYKLKSLATRNNTITPLQTSPGAMRRTKLKCEKNAKQTILTDKFSTTFGNNNNSNDCTNFNYNSLFENYQNSTQKTHNYQQQQRVQQQQQQQDKRDILLKIRQQIFERKRLRQLLNTGQRQNSQYEQQQQQQRLQQQAELQELRDVWRPW